MENKDFIFRYPPPPPPPCCPSNPPLPLTAPPVVQPPPPPPPTTTPNWGWSVDFSRPPPVYGSHSPSNGQGLVAHGYGVKQSSSPALSTASSSDSYGSYGNQDNTHYYGTNNRLYTSRRCRPEYIPGNQQGWGQRGNFKRPKYDGGRLEQKIDDSDRLSYRSCDSRYSRSTSSTDTRYSYPREISSFDSNSSHDSKTYEDGGHRCKKRKKPLSQAVPAKRAWTDEEARMAIEVEKEYNKLFKNHSLKIKFPDQELNREIVSKFHKSIETVYFQQPSNPRFCFVTLTDGADPNAVIEELNKIEFGLGFLSAEYKKDREEEQNVGADDIDPLTLYVGNLAQEVTKEDMVNFYPKNKRIDIGFAKKMRYTRYAFVSFKNVQDSIEAFKATHYADLHSKSMIVRFRRLHGTVGMPGEPKIQHSSKESQSDGKSSESISADSDKSSTASYSKHSDLISSDDIDGYGPTSSYDSRCSSPGHSPKHSPLHNGAERRTISECSDSSNFDPSLVKNEPFDYHDDEFDDYHSDELTETQVIMSPTESCKDFKLKNASKENSKLKGTVQETVVKKEPEFITPFLPEPSTSFPIRPIPLKEEPGEPDEELSDPTSPQRMEVTEDLSVELKEPKKELDNEISEPANPEVNEEEFNTTTDFGSVLNNLKRRSNFIP
ncbi:hypothetical protein HHI36_005995 [Cryptolaemus montrouzieri]|uniref:RRM domain-containing protein n=1 Tax=Cryptolaemus montrouzieri TaxID=559131 RepID=A0ABD2NVU6_9CUCU